jgi:hypothetical protein
VPQTFEYITTAQFMDEILTNFFKKKMWLRDNRCLGVKPCIKFFYNPNKITFLDLDRKTF